MVLKVVVEAGTSTTTTMLTAEGMSKLSCGLLLGNMTQKDS
jgi:hypothetical protein